MADFTASVIGLGYVGLPTAAIIANLGIDVIGVDANVDRVSQIARGHSPVIEPELDVFVRSAVQSGKLRAVTAPEPADVYLIAVPTPLGGNFQPDLGYLEKAIDDIAPLLAAGNLIILESTSPVGTTWKLCERLRDSRRDLAFPTKNGAAADVNVAYSPERVLPGRIMVELIDNDRVIGGLTKRCAERARDFYGRFVKGECILTDSDTAEMVKLAENAYRDVNIAFANELSLIGERAGIDVWEVIRLANRHPRVNILNPGPGVGGHCIAIDPWFLVHAAPDDSELIKTARQVNRRKTKQVVETIVDMAPPTGPIALFGLAYKADIDDLRESPAVEIVEALADRLPNELLVVEPNISTLPGNLNEIPTLSLSAVNDALEKGVLLVLLTDHREFRSITAEQVAGKPVVDTRGIWRRDKSQ